MSRWEALFADLEAQADAVAAAERAAEIEERTRAEVGRLRLVDRLRAARGQQLRVHCVGGVSVRGTVTGIGPDWLLVDEGTGREALIGLSSLTGVAGTGRGSAVPQSEGAVEARLGLRHVLRGIARDRSPLRVQLSDGDAVDGTLERIGADYAELAVHPGGEARRRDAVRELRLLPLAALVTVRRDT